MSPSFEKLLCGALLLCAAVVGAFSEGDDGETVHNLDGYNAGDVPGGLVGACVSSIPRDARMWRGMKAIPPGHFKGCGALETVSIPSSVTKIGASAFENCAKLKWVEIPAQVKNIGDRAFFKTDPKIQCALSCPQGTSRVNVVSFGAAGISFSGLSALDTADDWKEPQGSPGSALTGEQHCTVAAMHSKYQCVKDAPLLPQVCTGCNTISSTRRMIIHSCKSCSPDGKSYHCSQCMMQAQLLDGWPGLGVSPLALQGAYECTQCTRADSAHLAGPSPAPSPSPSSQPVASPSPAGYVLAPLSSPSPSPPQGKGLEDQTWEVQGNMVFRGLTADDIPDLEAGLHDALKQYLHLDMLYFRGKIVPHGVQAIFGINANSNSAKDHSVGALKGLTNRSGGMRKDFLQYLKEHAPTGSKVGALDEADLTVLDPIVMPSTSPAKAGMSPSPAKLLPNTGENADKPAVEDGLVAPSPSASLPSPPPADNAGEGPSPSRAPESLPSPSLAPEASPSPATNDDGHHTATGTTATAPSPTSAPPPADIQDPEPSLPSQEQSPSPASDSSSSLNNAPSPSPVPAPAKLLLRSPSPATSPSSSTTPTAPSPTPSSAPSPTPSPTTTAAPSPTSTSSPSPSPSDQSLLSPSPLPDSSSPTAGSPSPSLAIPAPSQLQPPSPSPAASSPSLYSPSPSPEGHVNTKHLSPSPSKNKYTNQSHQINSDRERSPSPAVDNQRLPGSPSPASNHGGDSKDVWEVRGTMLFEGLEPSDATELEVGMRHFLTDVQIAVAGLDNTTSKRVHIDSIVKEPAHGYANGRKFTHGLKVKYAIDEDTNISAGVAANYLHPLVNNGTRLNDFLASVKRGAPTSSTISNLSNSAVIAFEPRIRHRFPHDRDPGARGGGPDVTSAGEETSGIRIIANFLLGAITEIIRPGLVPMEIALGVAGVLALALSIAAVAIRCQSTGSGRAITAAALCPDCGGSIIRADMSNNSGRRPSLSLCVPCVCSTAEDAVTIEKTGVAAAGAVRIAWSSPQGREARKMKMQTAQSSAAAGGPVAMRDPPRATSARGPWRTAAGGSNGTRRTAAAAAAVAAPIARPAAVVPTRRAGEIMFV